MNMKWFGLIETKLFHFNRISGVGGVWVNHWTPLDPLLFIFMVLPRRAVAGVVFVYIFVNTAIKKVVSRKNIIESMTN